MKRTTARELAFKTIYSKFAENYDEINKIISTNLKGYTVERLFKIDLAIITLAVIELKYIKENPKEVIINEAVELAKKYSTEKSPRFINGVLADIVK